MKIRNRINILLSCMVVLTMGLVSACDDTVGGGTTTELGFPTDTLFADVVPGDTVPVSFNVGYNWKLNSDKDWCRVNGEDISFGGKAGAHTIDFVISDRGNLFSADEALITLYMNNESRVIACITRRASMEYDAEVSCGEKILAEGESIIIGISGELELDVKPNFNIAQLGYEFPSWVEMQRDGTTMKLSVREDSLKYTICRESDSLRIFKDSTFSRSFHVQYLGMNPQEIRVAPQLGSPLIVSCDASRAYVDEQEYESPVEFTVAALNDEYQILSLNYDKNSGYGPLTDEERWFTVADDNKGNVAISVTEANKENGRTAHLLALPRLLADSLAEIEFDAMIAYLFEENEGLIEFKEETKQFHLVQVAQDGEFDAVTITPETQWGLKVSADGLTYTTSSSINAGLAFEAPVEVTIDSYRGYHLLYMYYDDLKGYVEMSAEESWLDVVDDTKGNVRIGFSRNMGNMRTAYLLAVPLALIENPEELTRKLYGDSIPEEGPLELTAEAERFIVAQFIQDADEESSMKVINAVNGWKYLTVEKEMEQKWIDIATAKGVPANKIFRADLMSGASFLLNPLLAEEIWNPAKETIEVDTVVDSKGDSVVVEKVVYKDGIAVYGESGTQYRKDVHFEAEPTKMEEEEGDYMLVQFKANYDIKEEYYIIYFIAEDKYLKALVVWNYWE